MTMFILSGFLVNEHTLYRIMRANKKNGRFSYTEDLLIIQTQPVLHIWVTGTF